MRISIVSGVHIRRAQHLNQLFFELPATQGNPLPFIFFAFLFLFFFKFPYRTDANKRLHISGWLSVPVSYKFEKHLRCVLDAEHERGEEQNKNGTNRLWCHKWKKKKLVDFEEWNAPVWRRKKLNNMHSTKSKQSDCRGWLRRWMTGKKRVKPRNLSTKKNKKTPNSFCRSCRCRAWIRDVHELRERERETAPQF